MGQNTQGRLRCVALQGGALALCGAAILVWAGGVGGLAGAVDENCPFLGTDFLLHYYPTIATGEPDAVWYYPPTIAILLAPMGWMAPETANAVWKLLQLALLALWAIGPPHLLRIRKTWFAVAYTVVTVVSVPVLQSFVWGQVSTGLAVAGLIAFLLLERRPWLSGVLLGLAISAKVYPVLWLAWPAARRAFKSIAAAGMTVVATAGLLPVLVYGVDGTLAFYRAVAEHLAHSLNTWIPTNEGPQFLPSVVSRLTGTSQNLAMTVLSWIIALALLALLRRISSGERENRELAGFAVAGGLFAFLVHTSWLHYFVHLPIAWLVLGSAALAAARRVDRIVPAALLAISIAFSSLPWQELVAGGLTGRYAASGWLAWANIAALAGLAWTCCEPRLPEKQRSA
jgi:uncharacterized membrane protein